MYATVSKEGTMVLTCGRLIAYFEDVKKDERPPSVFTWVEDTKSIDDIWPPFICQIVELESERVMGT